MNLLIIIAYIVYAGTWGHTNDHPRINDCPRVDQLMLSEETIRVHEAFEKKYSRKRFDVNDAEQLALKSMFRDIETAYTNYQLGAMTTAMANVSNRIDHVQGQLYMDLHWGMMGFLATHFIQNRGRRRQFDAPSEFERFATAHTRTALFLGECYCRRNDCEAPLVWLENEVFGALKDYVAQFHNEGKKDFEEIAQGFLDSWIEHIESDKGFTRWFAHLQMDSYEIGIVKGQFSREEAIKWARNTANPLIKRGYTPKWLDDFK